MPSDNSVIMSFMFNPHPYDDPNAINRISLPVDIESSIIHGTSSVVGALAKQFAETATRNKKAGEGPFVVAFDGYFGAEFSDVLNPVFQQLTLKGLNVSVIDAVRALYKSPEELEAQFSENLPNDRVKDPVLLFGKLFTGTFEDLLCDSAVERLHRDLSDLRSDEASDAPDLVFVFGCGCSIASLRSCYDTVVYFDVTPKRAILRAKAGLVANFGDVHPRPFKELVRRFYYVDFEVSGKLRRELLCADASESPELFYVTRMGPVDSIGECTLLPRIAFTEVCKSLAGQPFRCRPVYVEGVWGGSFVSRVRKLPPVFTKLAWVFDLIPLEVSIVAETPVGLQVEMPYFTFVQKEGLALMGEKTLRRFGGYFPIRFNYDDTWHSSGNMSIQVHPTQDYIVSQNGEYGQQNESYYAVATGHGAKTYLGFNEGVTKESFFKEARRSEKDKTPINYEAYIHGVPSQPGTQFILPGGTIHASGQNQVVLEIGSLTVGSYTYKLYDYLRSDLDGNPRPIHMHHAENVLDGSCVAPESVRKLVPEPKRLRGDETGGWSEWLVGEHPDVYFSLRRLAIAPGSVAEDDTDGIFHVLVLVDGEEILIESKADPAKYFKAQFLDMVVVPANIGPYTVRNLGKQPVVVHKTRLKDA